MTEISVIKSLAREASENFERKKRGGKEIVVLKVGRPEWVCDLVQKAHDGMFPDDYRYEDVWDILNILADLGSDVETFCDLCDLSYHVMECLPTKNMPELAEWLNSHTSRESYCDEILQNCGGGIDTLWEVLSDARELELREVAETVIQFLQNTKG